MNRLGHQNDQIAIFRIAFCLVTHSPFRMPLQEELSNTKFRIRLHVLAVKIPPSDQISSSEFPHPSPHKKETPNNHVTSLSSFRSLSMWHPVSLDVRASPERSAAMLGE